MSMSGIEKMLLEDSSGERQSCLRPVKANKQSGKHKAFAALALAAAAFLGYGVWATDPYAGTVQGGSWERSVNVEKYQTRVFEGWRSELPSDARIRSCSVQTKTYKPLHSEDKCSYERDVWRVDSKLGASGGLSEVPQWPKAGFEEGGQDLGALRLGARSERYVASVVLEDGKAFECSISQAVWLGLAQGVRISVGVNKFGSPDCESLAALEALSKATIKKKQPSSGSL